MNNTFLMNNTKLGLEVITTTMLETHKVLAININREYKNVDYKNKTYYEVTRASWVIDPTRVEQAEYIFAEYENMVCAIFVPDPKNLNNPNGKWNWISHKTEKGNLRWEFEGIVCKDADIMELYMNKLLPEKKRGQKNPIRYFITEV